MNSFILTIIFVGCLVFIDDTQAFRSRHEHKSPEFYYYQTALIANKIKKELGELKALAPAYAKPIYDRLAKSADDALNEAIKFDQNGVLKVLKEDVITGEELIATITDPKERQHQMEIATKLKETIKIFESGTGTFIDIYNFYKFIESRLALDV